MGYFPSPGQYLLQTIERTQPTPKPEATSRNLIPSLPGFLEPKAAMHMTLWLQAPTLECALVGWGTITSSQHPLLVDPGLLATHHSAGCTGAALADRACKAASTPRDGEYSSPLVPLLISEEVKGTGQNHLCGVEPQCHTGCHQGTAQCAGGGSGASCPWVSKGKPKDWVSCPLSL